MRVLVTGAAGFVGRAVVRHLTESGHGVTPMTRADADLRDHDQVKGWLYGVHFDAVVHLAAFSKPRASVFDPSYTWASNVGGTANLLTAVNVERVVFASTNAVYGSAEGVLTESAPLKPATPYASSKLACEQLLREYADSGDTAVTVLRLFNVAGGWDDICDPDRTRILNNAMAVAAGERPHLEMRGGGSVRRDFVHLRDVAEAVRLALTGPAGPGRFLTMNIGSGVGTSMAGVVEAVERVTGRAVPVQHRPGVAQPQTLVADVGAAQRWLGWAPIRSFEQIVTDAWAAKPR